LNGWPQLIQKWEADAGFLNPQLLQVTGVLLDLCRIKVIEIVRTETTKIIPSNNSNGGLGGLGETGVEVVVT